MTHTRRGVLLTGLALVGCGGQPQPPTQETVATYTSLISAGLGGLLAVLTATPGVKIDPATSTKISGILDTISTNANVVANAVTVDPSNVTAVIDSVNALAQLVQPYYTAAPQIGALIQAALALVPLVRSLAKLPQPAAAPVSAGAPMSKEQAIATLKLGAAKR